MKKRNLLILGAVLVLALAAAAIAVTARLSPEDGPPMEEGDVRVYSDANGALSLAWPETEGAEYRLSVRPEGGDWGEEQLLSEPFAVLDGAGTPVQIRIQAVDRASGKNGPARTIDVEAAELEAPVLTASLSKGLASLTWTGGKGSVYEVASPDSPTPLASLEDTALELRFGPEEALDLPGADQPLRVTVRAGVPGKHYVFYGPPSQSLTIRREALLNDALSLTCEELQPRMFTLEWIEGRGDHYEVQEWRDGDWQLLERMEPTAPPRYETERLASGSQHRLRVAAVDSGGSVLTAEEAEFFASVDPLYATVWPILDLDFRNTPNGKTLKRIPAGTALCVLEEANGWFQVRYGNDYGYVDSRYCMINLAEYLGDYCSYDITNSYASIFKVHNSPISKVTRQIIPGFEHIRSANGFLVPYLYPCAQKLLQAAKSAIADGYRLRIYEAFRPNQSTRYLYDTTAAQLNYPALVEQDGYCIDPQLNCRVDLATGLYTDPATGKQVQRSVLAPPEPEPVPEPEPAPEPESEPGAEPETPPVEETPVPETPATPEENTPPAVPEGESGPQETEEPPLPEETPVPEEAPPPEETPAPLETLRKPSQEEDTGFEKAQLLFYAKAAPAYDTYGKIMTDNGRFGLGSFLARSVSAHNRGIALDLTLETLDGGQVLTMQSAMHDLSWYSAVYRNNENAKLLEKYMTATGMRGLSSEWWHFQDDETRESIRLNTYLSKGVDASGWTRDDHGWRWRNAEGEVQRNTTITVDGVRWTLDSNGYAVE